MAVRFGALLASTVASLIFAGTAGLRRVEWGHGSWSWFGDPRAVYVKGITNTTFVGWIDWRGDVTVGAYDPALGLMRSQIVGKEYHDDHSAPSILVEPDQRLTVFWSGHNGQRMWYRTTRYPDDIFSWGPLQHVVGDTPGRNGFTYPNPVTLPAEHNRLYLFWRGGNYSQDYETRTASGRWSAPHELIAQPHERPYVKYDTNGRDTIALAFTNGHPRETLTSVYFAEYRDGWLRGASGRKIKRLGRGPIAPSRGDLVYNGKATGVSAWVWDVAFAPNGRPVIVYATFPTRRNHEYWYASWNGHNWVSHFLTFAGPSISPRSIEYEYSGGIGLDHSDPSIVYLSRKGANGWEIERWTTPNGGYSWRHSVVVPAAGTQNVRPVVPRGGGPIKLLWLRGDYRTYTTYRTSIMFLSGP
ncbi:MAG TPA: BNR-4 repeat-containing protein [Solirubrobacteraceae bacterium]|nr:BNR-4 repeat-containing protein [Solirubrobacteraceae bacterium]